MIAFIANGRFSQLVKMRVVLDNYLHNQLKGGYTGNVASPMWFCPALQSEISPLCFPECLRLRLLLFETLRKGNLPYLWDCAVINQRVILFMFVSNYTMA